MITYVTGNLFESPAKVLVNAVNTVGVMGKGVAKTFKEIYPEMFRKYQELCEQKRLAVGQLWLYETPHKWILNFPTKEDWRRPSRPEIVDAGLRKFAAVYSEYGITSVAFPRLGCGNGELSWETQVQPLFEKYLAPLAIDVFVHHVDRLDEKPEHRNIEEMKSWLRSEPHSLGFVEFWSDLERELGKRTGFLTLGENKPFQLELTGGASPAIRLILNPDLYSGFWGGIRRKLKSLVKWRVESSDTIVIPQEAFLDLWQSVRSSGFLQATSMPGGLDQLAEYLMPFFARLTYFRPVELWTSRSETRQAAFVLHEPISRGDERQRSRTAVALRA